MWSPFAERPPRSVAPSAPSVVVDVDPWSYVVLAAAATIAVALFAIVSTAGNVLTGIGVGVLVGVALTPVVNAVQRRWSTSRGMAVVLVGAGLSVAFAAIVTIVAPAAVSQLRDFSDELPTTVRDFYSWPIIGPRLEDADAAGRVERWIDDAPADIDDATLADVGERLIGGVLSAVVVLVTALGVMIDGGVVVQRFRALVPLDRRARARRGGGLPGAPVEGGRGRWNSRCSGEMRRDREEHLWRRRPTGPTLTLRREGVGSERD